MRSILRILTFVAAAGLALQAAHAQAPSAPAGVPVNANMGAFSGGGTLTDRDGKAIGSWSVNGQLARGQFSGTGSVTINGETFSAPLRPGASSFNSGRCVFDWAEGRARAEISGPCTSAGLGGFVNAFIPTGEVYSVSGYAVGQLQWRAPGKAPAEGIIPTSRLTCAYMERIGGNVIGGGAASYELRFSNMGFLELGAGGIYRTARTSGRWVRGAGNSIKLVSGQFAGATGRLQADASGAPAVYFERVENGGPGGVPIVDIARTSCTQKR